MKNLNNVIIKAGPLSYTVKIVPGLENGDGAQLYGQAFHRDHLIKLNDSHNPQSAFTTLWHEILHISENVYALELSEECVTILASFISQLLQDNPMTLNWRINESDDPETEQT